MAVAILLFRAFQYYVGGNKPRIPFFLHPMTYQVLLVEHRSSDAELIQEALRQGPVSCSVTHVQRLADALACPVGARVDAVLLNLFLPDSNGLDTFVAMRSHMPAVPMILLADSAGLDVTREAVNKGAQDYLAMDEVSPTMLARTLLHAIERKRHERDLREQKLFYENLLLEANVWVEAMDHAGNTILWNTGAEKISGYPAQAMLSNPQRWEILYPDQEYRERERRRFEQLLNRESTARDMETEIRTASGDVRVLSWNASLIRGADGEVVGGMFVGNDVTQQHNDSRDLAENERRFRTLAELTTDYVYAAAVGDDGAIVTQWVEGAFERITGYRAEEVLGQSNAWWRIVDPADVPAPEKFHAALEKGSMDFDYRIRRKDGTVRWLRDRLRPLRDPRSNRITMLLGAVSDITKEKEARKSEMLARHTLDALITASHDYAFLLSPDGTILAAGPSVSALLGHNPEDVQGRTLFDFTPPDYPPEKLARLHALCTTNEVYEYTADFGARQVVVRGTPVFDDRGTRVLVAVFGHDVTEELRMKEFLQREQEKFRGTIENATDGISLVDSSGRFIEWNPALERITGIRREDALGQSFWDIQSRITPAEERSAETVTAYRAMIDEFLASDSAPWLDRLVPRWIHHADGSRRYLEMVSFRVRSSFETLIGTITRDITDIALAEKTLEANNALLAVQNEELSERNEELDTFTHSVAHDLKNPLSLILGYAEMAQFDGADFGREELHDYMESIIFNGRKMISIINSLLLLASARKEDVEMAPLDMAHIVSEALRRLEKSIKDNHIGITLPDQWFHPRGYAPWIEEVWINYIGNAIKHAGHGCHVVLTAERESDGMIRYSVTDDGEGIPAERLGDLFIPFTRLSQAKIEGQGLGLSIVKRIIEKQGGAVGVVSENGKGSRFSFTLHEVGDGT